MEQNILHQRARNTKFWNLITEFARHFNEHTYVCLLVIDPQSDEVSARALAAICVRVVDDLDVLQFTSFHAVRCALHRRTSRVIHRQEFLLS